MKLYGVFFKAINHRYCGKFRHKIGEKKNTWTFLEGNGYFCFSTGSTTIRCHRNTVHCIETRSIKSGNGCNAAYLSVCLCLYLSICLSICLSVYLSIYLSIDPPIHPSIHPSVYPSIYLSIYLYVYIYNIIGDKWFITQKVPLLWNLVCLKFGNTTKIF